MKWQIYLIQKMNYLNREKKKKVYIFCLVCHRLWCSLTFRIIDDGECFVVLFCANESFSFNIDRHYGLRALTYPIAYEPVQSPTQYLLNIKVSSELAKTSLDINSINPFSLVLFLFPLFSTLCGVCMCWCVNKNK